MSIAESLIFLISLRRIKIKYAVCISRLVLKISIVSKIILRLIIYLI